MTTDPEPQCVKKWLQTLAPSTQVTAKKNLRGFEKWRVQHGGQFASMTLDDLLNYQEASEKRARYDVLGLIQEYVNQKKGRHRYLRGVYSHLRGFFAHNHVDLPKEPFTIRSTVEAVEGGFTVQELRDLLLNLKDNPAHHAAALCIFQAGLDLEGFTYWNLHGYEALKTSLERGDRIIKISLPGRKKHKNVLPYYTYIGGDAVDALKLWLRKRPTTASAIFTNRDGDPISKDGLRAVWLGHVAGIGLAERKLGSGDHSHRTGKNLHELRDTFRTQWQKNQNGASPEAAEFFMGHVLDRLGYNKAYKDEEYMRGEYEKALPMLEIMSGDEPYGKVDRRRLRDIEKDMMELRRLIGNKTLVVDNSKPVEIDREGNRIESASVDEKGLHLSGLKLPKHWTTRED